MLNASQLVPVSVLWRPQNLLKLWVYLKVTKPNIKMPGKVEHILKYGNNFVNLTARTWKRASLFEPSFFGGILLDGKSSGRDLKTVVTCSTGFMKKAQHTMVQ